MSDVGGITGNPGINGGGLITPSGPRTVADALSGLRRHIYASLTISDSVQNIVKNLDTLQGYASKITAVSTTDVSKNMTVTGDQYQKDNALLDQWGAGS
jgi:hypothetical protein